MEEIKLIGLDLDFSNTLNYAMVHNGVPFMRKIRLKNGTGHDLKNFVLKLSFQEGMASEYRKELDVLPADLEVDLGPVKIAINPDFLFLLTEAMSTTMKITMEAEGMETQEEIREVIALAYNEWQGMDIMPEMLGAFVTPNHPSIDNILIEASTILKESGKDPSFEGYQRGDINRVREQVLAIYTALRNQNISYIGPPASFIARGQRVRLASEVLEKKMGTCLDLTLLFASCLEAVSINPLVVLVKGHSFLGFWQEEEFFQDMVEYDLSSLTKRSAEGMSILGLLETTDIRSGQDTSFQEAERHAEMHLQNEDDFVMAIDIRRSRVGGIKPLPERVLVDGNYIQAKEMDMAERILEIPQLKDVVKITLKEEDEVRDRKALWERKLLDLSLRNNLLNYVSGKRGIELLVPDNKSLEDALYEGKDFQILPKITDNEGREGSEPRKAADYLMTYKELIEGEMVQKKVRTLLDEENLTKKMTRMYRDARLHLEESGANSLFLSVGLLKWYENGRTEKERYAPLLLVPVEMKKKVGRNVYSISGRDEDTLMNVTLLEKLKQDFGIEIKGLDVLPQDEKGVDVMTVMSIMRNGILSQKRWDVLDAAHLGIFSFSKFIMWNDIRNHGEDLKKNKVIASLMEGRLTFEAERILDSERLLDEVISPEEILLPVSTDSSQLQAVDAAMKGKSFVLHGPPGTGKSQTITTIIANALYQGKRVLFVAEKMAALSVVQRRLEALGLGHFSLEVHSNKSKKTNILKKLEETTKMVSSGQVDFKAEAQKLKVLREELNQVVESLYTIYGFGLSAYELMGLLLYHGEEQELRNLNLDYAQMDKKGMEELFLLGRELSSLSEEIGEYENAPLKGMTIAEYAFDLKEQAENGIRLVGEKAQSLSMKLDEVTRKLGIKEPENKSQVDGVLELVRMIMESRLPQEMLRDRQGYDVLEMRKVQEVMKMKEDLEGQMLKDYESSLFLLDEKEIRTQFLQAEEKFVLFRAHAKNKILRIISAHRKTKTMEESQVLPLLNLLEEKKGMEKRIKESLNRLPALSKVLDGTKEERESDRLMTAIRELELLDRRLMGFTEEERHSLSENLLTEETGLFSEFFRIHEEFEVPYLKLKELLKLQVEELPTLEGNWAWRLKDRLETYANNLEELREWTSYNKLSEKAHQLNLSPLLEDFQSGRLSGKGAEGAVRRTVYKGAFLYILNQEKLLSKVTGRQFKEKIEYFKEVTDRYEDLAKREIQHVLASRVPDMMKEASSSSEVGILQRAIRSGGRGVTLRSLFDRLPNLLPRITPCMLMSPLSVAQYLGTKREYFDLVIFDEASQMPTAESVGAMARGKEVVIVGDPKQLPPTTFFSASHTGEEEEDGVMEDLDNILEDALALSMPETSLLWHYRSRHESLIAYSNRTYYENNLYTYPSPRELRSKVTYEFVEATYGRGGTRSNKKEADAVVHEIIERLRDDERRMESIGVVTFSMAQKEIIEDTLQEALREYPEIEERILSMEEPVFVKNLENVQGDERDVILFSIGYGPDENGRITLNFGPLNRENGWKRLNVAITRAKKEMKIFTSIKPELMDTAKTTSQGIHDLKGFLEYARRGTQAMNVEEIKERMSLDTFSDAVRKELMKHGLKVDTRVGASKYRLDLAIIDEAHPDEYLLGILCHGESYKKARSARDRDILQESVLQGLGWNLTHIYPMDWMENKDKEVEKVLNRLKELKNGGGEKEKAKPPTDLKVGHLLHKREDTAVEENPSGLGRAYSEAQFSLKPLSAEEFRMPKNTRIIRDVLTKIIEVEAPISLPLLYGQTLKAFGVRNTAKSIQTIDNNLSALGYDLTEEDGEFYILGAESAKPIEFYRFGTRNFKREARDLPREEIRLALRDLILRQVSLPEETLLEETMKVFGYPRGNEALFEKVRAVLHETALEGIRRDESGNYVSNV